MLNLTERQQFVLDSEAKEVTWIFTTTVPGPTTYYWSTKEHTFLSQTYDNRIIPGTFTGIQLTPAINKVIFEVTNPNNTLSGAAFEDQAIQIDCIMNNWVKERIVATWRFYIRYCEHFQQKLKFTCEDFLQPVLEGDYPNTKLIRQLSPSKDEVPNDTMCVPIGFGTQYHPVRSLYISNQRYYFLGPDSPIYNITKIRSPGDWGSTSEWLRRGIWTTLKGMGTYSTNLDQLWIDYGGQDADIFASGGTYASAVAGYTFSTATKTLDGDDYRVFQPIIADSDKDGLADASGLWLSGERFLDPALQYTRSDTATLVSPHNVIEYVLEDMGVDSANLDTGPGSSFATAGNTFSDWGLSFNGAFYYRLPRVQVIGALLGMCNSVLRVTDKIELHVIDKASKMTLTSAHIKKPKEVAISTLKYSRNFQKNNDSGYIAYNIDDEPQNKLTKILVSAKGPTDNTVNETVNLPFIQDSQHAQKLGMLYYQKKLGHKAKIVFTARDDCMVLQPKDVITISGSDYGGTYKVMIESVTIKHDLSVDLVCARFEWALDNWEDLAPGEIVIAEDDSEIAWQPVIAGPDGSTSTGDLPNFLPGKVRIGISGDHILIDPDVPDMKILEGGIERLRIGELDPERWDRVALWGMSVTDDVGAELLRIDTQTAFIAGWNFTSDKLYTDNIEIDSANEKITLPGIIIDGANNQIRSVPYTSGSHGEGFTLEPDFMEVGNMAVRGVIRSAVFQKDTISAVGGNVLITYGSDTLAADMGAGELAVVTLNGEINLAIGDVIRMKDGEEDEWLEVSTIGSAPSYMCMRDRAGQYAVHGNPSWRKGTTVVNYGQSGYGGILMTASEQYSPYMSVFTHAGEPWTSEGLSTRLRVGNLNGFLDYTSDAYGIAIGEIGDYMTYDPVQGLRVKGTITVGSGVSDGNVAWSVVEDDDGTRPHPSWRSAPETTTINGNEITTKTVTATKINVVSIREIDPALGHFQDGGQLTGITFYSVDTARKLIINVEGVTLHVTSNVGKWGSDPTPYVWGDSPTPIKYGTGALAYIHHISQKVPFYISAEQTVADFHYYNRGADPTGLGEVGDTCVRSGKLKICITGGTPGTWATVGVQT